jgi:hypothetical protein
MNKDTEYALANICKGHVSGRFSFYPGIFSEDCFAENFRLLESRDNFDFVKEYLGLDIEQTMEIGVDGGNYSRKIVDALNPKTHYCVDPYRKYDHPHSHSWPQEKIDELYNNLIGVVFKDEVQKESVKVLKMLSSEATASFADETFDFIYIDGNHWFEYVNSDLIDSSRIIKKTGIIAGHDFHGDVPAAVYSLCKNTNFKLAALALDVLKDGRLCPSFYLTWSK